MVVWAAAGISAQIGRGIGVTMLQWLRSKVAVGTRDNEDNKRVLTWPYAIEHLQSFIVERRQSVNAFHRDTVARGKNRKSDARRVATGGLRALMLN